MFRTIKTKLTIGTILFLLLVVMVQIGSSLLFADDYYMHIKKGDMQQAFSLFQNNKNFVNSVEFAKMIEEYEENKHFRFIIGDKHLNTIYDSKQEQRKESKWDFEKKFDFYRKARLFSENPEVILRPNSIGGFLRLYGKVVEKDETWYVVIRTSLPAIKNTIHTTNRFLWYISMFACLIGGIIVYFYAKKFVRPIEEIDRVAMHIANQDFSLKASEKGADEIGRLAVNINKMSEHLKNDMDLLKEYNIRLQEDIRQKAAEEEIRKEFISNVSHELKTPLEIMLGYTEMLKEEGEEIDREYYYNVLIDETKEMSRLVEQLLNLSNMENQLEKIEEKTISFSELMEELLNVNRILFQQKELQVETDFDKDCIVRADGRHIKEAVNNYLSNAIRYTPQGGKIKVSLKKEEDNIVLYVFNEGENIPEKEIEKIWDHFYQIDKSRKKGEEKNIGLGLYIVKKIMEAHKGGYGVINKEGGVEFYLSLRKM